MLWSGVTPGNPMPGHDLWYEKVTLFGATAQRLEIPGETARGQKWGGVPTIPSAMRNAQSE
jgi:hypothetical protein